ncbi:hypothetical protein AB4Y38_40695 [Paraburkholderia sp. EG285A]|uniref:hypothetical protein n=1 Tax=Paraburkholderia sp. EG285A TaxID=3237009 RepID=UPI0034D2025D
MHSQQLSQPNPASQISAGRNEALQGGRRPREVAMRTLKGRDLIQFGGWDTNWKDGLRAAEAVLGTQVPSRVNEAVEADGLLIMCIAHRRIRICAGLGDQRLGALRHAIDSSLGVITELGHSRTFLRLEGPDARYLMSMLMPIDFAQNSFPLYAMAQSHIHHTPVLAVAVLDDDGSPAFDLHLPRTFAESVAEWIIQCGAVEAQG